jgi:uncharacterized protein (TIGR02588 family)
MASEENNHAQEDEPQKQQPSLQKRAAEAFTLGWSLLIVGGLTLYLIIQARNPTSDFVHVRTQFLWREAQRKGESTILPVEVENTGRVALRLLQVRVSFVQGGQEQERDLDFDYVAGGSKRRAYLVFEPKAEDLRRFAKLKAEPLFYTVE